nr:MAG TPA: capsid scaffolding protein [Caudoviricetes sp.]
MSEETNATVSTESTETVDTQETVDTKQEDKHERTFTRADVGKMVSAEVAKARKTWESEQEAKESEAKKLAKMNADEKKDYQLKQREQELATREAEITRKELTAEAKTMLSERDLPIELVNVVNLTDADSVSESINVIQKSWEAAVQKGVSERLKGGAPMKSAQQNQQEEVPKWKKDFLR